MPLSGRERSTEVPHPADRVAVTAWTGGLGAPRRTLIAPGRSVGVSFQEPVGVQVICVVAGAVRIVRPGAASSSEEILGRDQLLCGPGAGRRGTFENVGPDDAVVVDCLVAPEQFEPDAGGAPGSRQPGTTVSVVRLCAATTAVLDALTCTPGRDPLYRIHAGRFLAVHLGRLLVAPSVPRSDPGDPGDLGDAGPGGARHGTDVDAVPVAGFSAEQRTALIASMRARVAEPVRVAELAALVGYSPYHFNRRFHATFATTPYQYLTALRIETAQQLLTDDPARPMAWVAAQCGFGRTESLIRAFRARTGSTPGRYAAALRRKTCRADR